MYIYIYMVTTRSWTYLFQCVDLNLNRIVEILKQLCRTEPCWVVGWLAAFLVGSGSMALWENNALCNSLLSKPMLYLDKSIALLQNHSKHKENNVFTRKTLNTQGNSKHIQKIPINTKKNTRYSNYSNVFAVLGDLESNQRDLQLPLPDYWKVQKHLNYYNTLCFFGIYWNILDVFGISLCF